MVGEVTYVMAFCKINTKLFSEVLKTNTCVSVIKAWKVTWERSAVILVWLRTVTEKWRGRGYKLYCYVTIIG